MRNEHYIETAGLQSERLTGILRGACKKIAPLWPLENFVAVNPYLGLADRKFENAAQSLASLGGIQMTLPTEYYKGKITEGVIAHEDLATALSRSSDYRNIDVEDFLKGLNNDSSDEEFKTVSTLIDVATQWSQKDWNRFATSRISVWAASYFDHGQATWVAAARGNELFPAWKVEAETDRTPEIAGLKGFRKFVKALPDHPVDAANAALELLEIPEDALPHYLHRLLLKFGGWSAHAARLDWDSELYDGEDGKLMEFLAVLLCWEVCVLQCLDKPKLRLEWIKARKSISSAELQNKLHQGLSQKLVLQEAFDLSAQRAIIDKFRRGKTTAQAVEKQARAQAIFCIDVRSEVYRRNLEMVDPEVETLGFAGFFAFPIKYIPIGHAIGEAQCPVLIKTGPTIMEEMPSEEESQEVLKSRCFL